MSTACTAAIGALGPIDLKMVVRDSMLRWLAVVPFLFAFLFRYGVPALNDWLGERHGIDLTPHYPLLTSFLVLMVPTMIGSVVGFLLLDQRDDRTLTALLVTPLTVKMYLAYRTAVPMVLSVPVMMASIAISDIVTMGALDALLASVQAAPAAPLYALFVAGFARNKVQGFALLKGMGVLTWPPIAAWFVTSPWQLACGIDPLYWPLKVFWTLEAGEPHAWVYFLVGLLYQSLLVAALLSRLKSAIGR